MDKALDRLLQRPRIRALSQRFRLKRHDELGREQGQTVVRVVIVACVLSYLLASLFPIAFETGPPLWLVYSVGYFALSVAMMLSAFRDTVSSFIRRTTMNVADATTISYLMISTGQAGIPLFVLYLWITLGNGFRFGLRAMTVSAVLSFIGFSAVVAYSDAWGDQPMFAAGVLTGLLLIPGYAAHLIRQLHHARQRAEEASAAKSNFLARMSHELRTPLDGILGTTDLLAANKRLTPEDRSLLDVIRDSVKVSTRQIDGVLDFSRIEAGKLVIEQVGFDLHELLIRVARPLRGIARESNLRLALRIDPAIPYRLVGDPHHLQEVLVKLLSNAVKFTSKGQVSLEARLLHENERSALVRFEVHDTGVGISPEAQEHIFEAFSDVVADADMTRGHRGTGLGTATAKRLVELMGGRIGVNSTREKGSIFFAEIRFACQAPSSDHLAPFADMRILLISKSYELRGRMASLAGNRYIDLNVVPSIPDALGLLGRSIRVGRPMHIVFADSHIVFAYDETSSVGDFLEKTWLAFTPVYLLCDVVPEEDRLRRWGFTGVLPQDLPLSPLLNALHVGRAFDIGAEQGVVRVEPWAWMQHTSAVARRVLIVDDNLTNLFIVETILKTAGYQVDSLKNPMEALERLASGDYRVAILDLHMPGMDGIKLLRRYRQMRPHGKVRIVFLTANTSMDATRECADAGADAFLAKPVKRDTLLGTVESLLHADEIHSLASTNQARGLGDIEDLSPALLNRDVLRDLTRLYDAARGNADIVGEFRAEAETLLTQIEQAAHLGDHQAFSDSAYALRACATNIGATSLAAMCHDAGAMGIVEFRREGINVLSRVREIYRTSLSELEKETEVSVRR